MKPSFEFVKLGDSSSIKVKTYNRKKMNVPFHYHPEHEIVLVLKGSGKVIISDSVTTYARGELFIIGGSIPHLFVDDDPHANEKPGNNTKVLVVQFKEDLFKNILHLPEFFYAGRFLSKIGHGIKVSRLSGLHDKVVSLSHAQGIEKFNILTYIFDHLERKRKYEIIAREICYEMPGTPERIRQVHSFLAGNFTQNISIEEAAKAVHLSKTSFCRFLKNTTQKTFTEHLNELRIHKACKLLRETSFTVTQICYEVGFNNISYFYRQFKKLRHVSPHEYQQQYLMVNS